MFDKLCEQEFLILPVINTILFTTFFFLFSKICHHFKNHYYNNKGYRLLFSKYKLNIGAVGCYKNNKKETTY